MEDRAGLIEALDAKIAEVEEQHAELVDRAAESGIGLELLPEVRVRRANAQWREERARHVEADRQMSERLRGRS